MKGSASLWYELQRPEDISEAKLMFKQHYWGIQAQMNFRHNLHFGKFKQGDMSMSEYALGLARQARTLTSPMLDEEIIQTIKEHFDGGVARELRPSIIKTVDETVNMLDTIESE